MSKLLIILSLLAVTSLAAPIDLQDLKTLWSAWKVYYNKFYTEGEETARFAIFVDNYEKIVNLNSKNTGVKFAMNNFGDLTSEEFKYIYASGHGVEPSGYEPDFNTPTQNFDIGLPTSVDWRTKNAIAPVESQGQCGACWVFAAVGSLESFHYINNGSMIVFSNQQIIDCAPKSAGCDEGLMSKAYVYTAAKGMEPQADYPYTAQVGTCEYNASLAIKVNTGFQWLPFKDVNAFKTALVKQPVATVIEADQEIFQFYSSGVISQDCGSDVDHSVLVVGYETYSGQDAFIVQNSWGDQWGDKGYVYISTNATANHGNGVCGILSSPIIPV